MLEPDNNQLAYVAIDQDVLEAPNGIIQHYKDHWWAVHPEKGLIFYYKSAQCNKSREIVATLVPKLYPWAEIKFFPSIFRRINISDYT